MARPYFTTFGADESMALEIRELISDADIEKAFPLMTGIPCRIDVATLLDAPERAGR